MSEPDPRDPPTGSIDRPSVARMYDFYLGGSHNFEVDRAAARAAINAAPEIVAAAHANRAFLSRVVHFAACAGIGQFLDLGSGIPTVGNVHEVARRYNTDARVVYVDHDPVAVAHARALLAGDPRVSVLGEDVLRLPGILDQIAADHLLDLDQPIAALLVSVGHFIPGDIPALLTPLRRLVPASLLAISHATTDPARHDPSQLAELRRAYAATPSGLHPRSEAEILAMFAGFPLAAAEIGQPETTGQLVPINNWRPDAGELSPSLPSFLGGVGIRRPTADGHTSASPFASRTAP